MEGQVELIAELGLQLRLIGSVGIKARDFVLVLVGHGAVQGGFGARDQALDSGAVEGLSDLGFKGFDGGGETRCVGPVLVGGEHLHTRRAGRCKGAVSLVLSRFGDIFAQRHLRDHARVDGHPPAPGQRLLVEGNSHAIELDGTLERGD